MSGSVLYGIACVLVPVAWGLIVWAITNAIERKIKAKRGEPSSIAQDDQV